MISRQTPLPEKHHRSWIIVRVLPSSQVCTVARFTYRQDADDHLRVLRRFVPGAVFEIMFEPPAEEGRRQKGRGFV